jgi:hypothetical protein
MLCKRCGKEAEKVYRSCWGYYSFFPLSELWIYLLRMGG